MPEGPLPRPSAQAEIPGHGLDEVRVTRLTGAMSTFAVTNPNTGEVEETFDSLTEEQLKDVVDRADAAYQDWSQRSYGERGEILNRFADLFEARQEELAEIVGHEMGKPKPQTIAEVKKVAATARWYAEHAEEFLSPTELHPSDGVSTVVKHDPLGVLLSIMPWNFPYNQLARFALPNLMVGNAIIMKQAAICPKSSQALADLLVEAGLPEGVYTNVHMDSSDAKVVLGDPRVKGFSLTGSEKAGAAVAGIAAKHLKRSVLELGGNDPLIVLDTDDVEALAKKAVSLRLANAGQVCTSPKRFIVLKDIYDEFVAAAKKAVEATVVGDYDAEDTDMGPLSSESARDELVESVQQAVKDGATLHCGGEKLDRPGWFMSPALITDAPLDSDMGCREMFGPIVNIFKAEDEEDAIRIANDTPYGLMGSVWSKDVERARRVGERVQVGMLQINAHMESGPEFPFGGINLSGYGREGAQWALREFTNEKTFRVHEQEL